MLSDLPALTRPSFRHAATAVRRLRAPRRRHRPIPAWPQRSRPLRSATALGSRLEQLGRAGAVRRERRAAQAAAYEDCVHAP